MLFICLVWLGQVDADEMMFDVVLLSSTLMFNNVNVFLNKFHNCVFDSLLKFRFVALWELHYLVGSPHLRCNKIALWSVLNKENDKEFEECLYWTNACTQTPTLRYRAVRVNLPGTSKHHICWPWKGIKLSGQLTIFVQQCELGLIQVNHWTHLTTAHFQPGLGQRPARLKWKRSCSYPSQVVLGEPTQHGS